MKSSTLIFLFLFISYNAVSQEDSTTFDYQKYLDSIEDTFKFQYGTIRLSNGVANVTIPKGYKYLNAEQAEDVLYNIWGNPKESSQSFGFIIPEKQKVLAFDGYVFNIEYEEMGYVEDDDADDIDYDEMLADLRKDEIEENKMRAQQGYEPVYMLGWASKPFYDKERKVLHWAKSLKFGEAEDITLNYNIRVLGRKGVLILNAIAMQSELAAVKKDIPAVLNMVKYNKGFRYDEFDSSNDHVAEWTIGGLVAGKVLAKVGFFALLLKFWKIIALAVAGAFVAIRKFIFNKNKKEEVESLKIDSPPNEIE